MVSKLASVAWMHRDQNLTPGAIHRDEIRLVVTDTTILCESDDPHALLEQWKDGA